jgi:hypothetical protein
MTALATLLDEKFGGDHAQRNLNKARAAIR